MFSSIGKAHRVKTDLVEKKSVEEVEVVNNGTVLKFFDFTDRGEK